MLKEFKEFAMKGNIMDLAIGVVIGGAFQKIVNSLVEDLIMPAISILTGRVDFSNLVLKVGNATIKYGNFITTIVNFLIIAFSIFLVVRYLNKLNRLKELGELATKLEKKAERRIRGKKKEEEVEDEIAKAEEEEEKKPETKICPYCYTEIKYEATRCPHCTSMLENLEEEKIKEEIDN